MNKICNIEGCGNTHVAKGFCDMHYRRMKRHGTTRQTRSCHGRSRTKEHRIWCGIIQRCENKNNPAYKNYGGRGIKICGSWRNDFELFFRDMGKCPDNMSIERIDNDKGYNARNCRWASRAEQSRNMRSNRLITHKNKTLCLADWSEITGLHYDVLRYRLDKGWPITKSLTEPSRYCRKNISTKRGDL